MKKTIIIIIALCCIAFGGVVIFAANEKYASEMMYHDRTVEAVLDDLYTKVDKPCQNVTGDKNTVGSKYICDLGDGVPREMFVLKVNDNSVVMLFEYSLSLGVNYATASNYFNNGGAGYSLAQSWTNVDSVGLPNGGDIVAALNFNNWNIALAQDMNWFYLGTKSQTLDKAENAKVAWLFNYTSTCVSSGGCTYELRTGNSYSSTGYWTSSPVYNGNNYQWVVKNNGSFYYYQKSNSNTAYSVRPAVTIAKSKVA